MNEPTRPDDEHALRTEALYQDRLVPCYANRPAHLDAMFRASVQRRSQSLALEEGELSLTYAELDQQVGSLAEGWAARGIGAGDRVALFLGNRIEFVVVLLSLWRLGAIAVPIGIRQSAAELEYMLGQCGASALVFEGTLADRLPQPDRIPSVRLFAHCLDTDESPSALVASGIPSVPLAQVPCMPALPACADDFSDQSPACIMYTSGTTGHPKGAVLSHLGFFHTARHYIHRFGYRPDDRMLLVIPGSHISGLLAAVVVTLQVGGCLVCMRQFDAPEVLRTMQDRRITATVMVPAMYNLCLLQPEIARCDLSAWRIGHFGGAAMPEVTIERLAQMLPALQLYNGFGATETTSAVTLTERGDAARYPDSVGTLLPCIDIRVLDPQGCEVPPGAPGELWIRSPGNAIGYWNQPEATRATFVAGYWRSGDIGSVDAAGYLRVFDRIKDMINRGGYKVYCVELENCIQRCEGVVEAAAVASPCPVLGERIHVFVYTRTAVDTEGIRQFCRSQLADYKTPDFITIRTEPLPRNLNGKLVKAPLREAARATALQSTHR